MATHNPYGAPTHHTTVIVNEAVQFGPKTQSVTCPNCNHHVHTKIKYKSSSGTHIWALLCCFICWPLFCCPYCCGSCMNIDHYCPKCKTYLGTYHN